MNHNRIRNPIGNVSGDFGGKVQNGCVFFPFYFLFLLHSVFQSSPHCEEALLEEKLWFGGKKSRTIANQTTSMVLKLNVAELCLSGIVTHPL